MSDPDGNPLPDPPDPRHVLPPSPAPLAPAPRVNPPNITSRQKEAPGTPGNPTNFNDFLQWARTFGGGEAPPDEAPGGAPSQRTLIPKEKKKFQRRDADARTEKSETGYAPLSPADAPPDEYEGIDEEMSSLPGDPAAADPAARPEGHTSMRSVASSSVPLTPRARRQKLSQKRSGFFWIGLQLGMIALLVGSFFLGRITVPKLAPLPLPAPAAPVVTTEDGKTTMTLLSPQNADLIDQAMVSTQANDFKKATELLEKVKGSGERVRGIDLQLAYLAAFGGDQNRSIPLLNQSISAGEDEAECYNMRATINNRRGGGLRGMGDFEIATKLDPFNARYFFYWGEALRRAGKPQAALVHLRQAADRLREPGLVDLYRLKVRLAQIELGQEKEFADEMAGKLALRSPPLDWLVTAAAVEMHKGKYAAAAAYLDKAEATSDPATFAARLRDYYLFSFKYEKELTRFFPAPATSQPGATSAAAPAPAASPAGADIVPPVIGMDAPASPSLATPR